MIFRIIIFQFLFFFSLNGFAAVWPATNKWDSNWENQYSLWIAESFNQDIFTNPRSPWFGIRTDCADAVYAARAIFAFTVSLPIDFTDSTGNPALKNSSNKWDTLPKDQRFNKFLSELLIDTSSTTLSEDTYPIQILPETIVPGTIFLNASVERDGRTLGGHAELVKSVEENGFIRTIYSTTPAKKRSLITSRNPYHWPSSLRGGYRAWKWPKIISSKMPHFSTEQFHLSNWSANKEGTRRDIFQWHESVRKIIRKRAPSTEERRDVIIESLCNMWKGRKEVVEEAWNDIRKNGMKCLSSDEMDEYSTTQRDRRIGEAYRQLYDLLNWYKKDSGQSELFGDLRDAEAELKSCTFELAQNYTIDAWELFLRQRDGKIFSSAQWSPAVRWGIQDKTRGSACIQ